MVKACKIGLGLAAALGLMMTGPVMADEACQRTLASVDRATETLTKMQQFFAQMDQRQASVASVNVVVPMKCPACGMMMPTSPTGNMTRAVKYNGKTYYCCAGCDMSATADKDQ
jgi:hypothetical protein